MKSIAERIEEGLREVGVLLIAFAPLDVALNHRQPGNLTFLSLFFGLGISLFAWALILERRRGAERVMRGLLISLGIGLFLVVGAFVVGLGAM